MRHTRLERPANGARRVVDAGRIPRAIMACFVIGALARGGFAEAQDLAGYFGFEPLEIVKVGRRCGPMISTDVDGDGLHDLVVVNNHDSRIEIHHQRANARPDVSSARITRVNEFPEHWRFRRQLVSVTHRVTAVTAHDFDGDGMQDLIYAGAPPELVFMRQTSRGVFDITRRHRVKNLSATRDGLMVIDVKDDPRPELLAMVDGAIRVWTLDGDDLGEFVDLSANEKMVAMVLEDFDGNGRTDIAGVIPDDAAPVRIWFGSAENGHGVIGPRIRFEMPPIIEADAIRLPGESAARLAVIERSSKRIVVYAVDAEPLPAAGRREAALWIHGFTDAGNRKRAHAVIDLDGDGLQDLVTTDTEANAVVAYAQVAGKGFHAGRSFPSLTDMTHLVAGEVDDDPDAELFVLSESEGVVGRCDVRRGEIPFPTPLNISSGHTPKALNLVELEHGPHIAIVAKDGRNYVLDLIDMAGETTTIKLGKLSRSPESITALDADQDGLTDLLLFTREKPMTMLHATGDGFELTESKDMGQYGLVQAARSDNIAIFDIDGDEKDELLIANKNYIRAVRYEPEPEAGTSPGWQVVVQINARDSTSDLVSLTVRGDRIIAADRENERLIMMARSERAPDAGDAPSRWEEVESVTVRGFAFDSIHAGSFSGTADPNILAVGEEGFAVIRLAGERITLREVASYRSDDDRVVEHELATGDLNADGFTDMVALDAGEQMCEVFTFSETGNLLYATGFQVYESRLFSGGDGREYEPSQAIVVDVTGDGADDLVLLAHNRVLVYPQMTDIEFVE